jgi:hypothetical protein
VFDDDTTRWCEALEQDLLTIPGIEIVEISVLQAE